MCNPYWRENLKLCWGVIISGQMWMVKKTKFLEGEAFHCLQHITFHNAPIYKVFLSLEGLNRIFYHTNFFQPLPLLQQILELSLLCISVTSLVFVLVRLMCVRSYEMVVYLICLVSDVIPDHSTLVYLTPLKPLPCHAYLNLAFHIISHIVTFKHSSPLWYNFLSNYHFFPTYDFASVAF